jgi:hypothetical protein
MYYVLQAIDDVEMLIFVIWTVISKYYLKNKKQKNLFTQLIMQDFLEEVKKVFKQVSMLDCIKEFTLIGLTVLALQIGHRLIF